MTQKDLIIKWISEQENATTIHNKLVSIFGSLALSYPSVTKQHSNQILKQVDLAIIVMIEKFLMNLKTIHQSHAEK